MKKIITLNTIILSAILLLTACGSNNSITKRHYSKGYYVSHSKGKHGTNKTNEKKSPLEYTQLTVKSPLIKEITCVPINPIKKDLVASNEKTYNKESKSVYASKSLIHIPTIHDDTPVINLKKAISKKQSAAASDSAGLSLLWIIVVVLLILWALGLLAGGFGLGGFINILLVIALILFILWLLRIL